MSQVNSFISIDDDPPRNQYTASGSQTVFDYTFPIFSSDDLVVVETDSSDVDTTRTEGTGTDQYAVSGVNDEDGGTITFTAARTDGNRITIYRNRALSRASAYKIAGGFSASLINYELGSLMMLLQQINDKFNRIIQAETADLDATLTLPRVADRASQYLSFDSSGNLIASPGTNDATPINSAMVPLVQAATLAAARAVLGLGASDDVTHNSATLTALTTNSINGGSATLTALTTNSINGGSATLTALTTNSINGGQLAGHRNKIINGNFTINQRAYVSGTPTTRASQYTLDNWAVAVSGENLAFAADTTTKIDYIATAPAGGIYQYIEGSNLEAGTYTLSWSGTATAKICESGGTLTTIANGGTFTVTGGVHVQICFYSGTVTRVQFEKGTVDTPFERRPETLEHFLCKRYYQKLLNLMKLYGGTGNTVGQQYNYPVRMRTTPTVTSVAEYANASGFTLSSVTSQSYAGIFTVTSTGTGTCNAYASLDASI